jgi:SAM-dependent methyltransferase
MTKASPLAVYREKWREAPQGSDTDGRAFSSDLLTLSDDRLLACWDAMAARRATGELGWFAPLYCDTFRERRVLELGSGLGFDAMRFAERGARWTGADIVPDNLALLLSQGELQLLAGRKSFLPTDGWAVVCPPGLFADGAEVDLRPHFAAPVGSGEVVLEAEVRVTRGAVGIGMTDEQGKYLLGAEVILEAGEDWLRVVLRSGESRPSLLRMRNLYAGRRARLWVRRAVIRTE